MLTPNCATSELHNSVSTDASSAGKLADFICQSPAMLRILDQVGIVGPHLRLAVIEGESGVGKQALARLLHRHHTLRHPAVSHLEFIRSDSREWLLTLSDVQLLSGFIFLDRVDLLPAPGQALLLRVLKDLDVLQPRPLVRGCSSEASLRDLARKGQFHAELALRLTSVRFAVPPLRERKEEIVPLSRLFLQRLASRYHLPEIDLSPDATARLLGHCWPGNLHELSSILESAVVGCSSGTIQASELGLRTLVSPLPESVHAPELLNLDAAIQGHVLHVLDLNQGNRLKTARQLGISRSTLYRLLDKHLSPCR